jgi:RHS repeat-associated protein
VIESRSYTAFGDELTTSGTGARTSYIGRETDNESDLGFGACPEALRGSVRLYDPTYGRFLSTDPLWSKYLPLQSYQYAGNSPVGALDPGGDTIIVLQDWEGAEGAGHSALLIGGDDIGWKLYSKNGGEYKVFGASKDPQAGEGKRNSFGSLAEFREAATDPNGTEGRYDNALLIPTTAEEDRKAMTAAEKQVKKECKLFGASCVTVVRDALEAAGKLPVLGSLFGSPIRGLSLVPNVAFKQIDAMPESTNVDSRVISPERNDPERKEEK